jgi:hypothetical protein
MSWELSDDDLDGGEPTLWDAPDRPMSHDEDEGHEDHEGEEDDDEEDDPDYRDEPDEDDEFHGNNFHFHRALPDVKKCWLLIDY